MCCLHKFRGQCRRDHNEGCKTLHGTERTSKWEESLCKSKDAGLQCNQDDKLCIFVIVQMLELRIRSWEVFEISILSIGVFFDCSGILSGFSSGNSVFRLFPYLYKHILRLHILSAASSSFSFRASLPCAYFWYLFLSSCSRLTESARDILRTCWLFFSFLKILSNSSTKIVFSDFSSGISMSWSSSYYPFLWRMSPSERISVFS